MGEMALKAVDVPSLNFNERSFTAFMAENDGSIGQNERAADGLADTSSLASWLNQTCIRFGTVDNTPPITAPNTLPPTLIVSSMGYTDDESDRGLSIHFTWEVFRPTDPSDEEEQEVIRQLSGPLTVRNPDASVLSEARPLLVLPPRSESALLSSPIKLEIKEEEEVKFLVKKERSSSITISPMVEVMQSRPPKLEDESPLPSPSTARPATMIPATRRRSTFRSVPSINTQIPSEGSEQLFLYSK